MTPTFTRPLVAAGATLAAAMACTLLHNSPTDAAPWCGRSAETIAAGFSGWGAQGARASSSSRSRRHDMGYEKNLTAGGATCGHCPIKEENVCDLPDVRDMFAPDPQAVDGGWLRMNLTFHMFSDTEDLLPAGITQAHVDAQTGFINSVYEIARIKFVSHVELHVNEPLGSSRVMPDGNPLAKGIACGHHDFGATLNAKCVGGFPIQDQMNMGGSIHCVCPGKCLGTNCYNNFLGTGINFFDIERGPPEEGGVTPCTDCACDDSGHSANVGLSTNASANIDPYFNPVSSGEFDQVPGANQYFNLNHFQNRRGDDIKYKFNTLPAGSEVKFVIRRQGQGLRRAPLQRASSGGGEWC